MDGVAKKADPGAPWNENLYELVEGRAKASEPLPDRLPRTLIEALDGFRADPLMGASLGEGFRDIYLRQKKPGSGSAISTRSQTKSGHR